MANTSVGGYDLNWLEEPPDDLKCLICLEVAKDPYQHGSSLCGKVFCNGCITEYQKHKTTCPNCRKDLSLFQDARSTRHIKALKVKCSNLVNGCHWVGDLGSLDAHLQSCDYALLPCTNKCKIDNEIAKFLVKDLKDHLTNDCPRRQYKCPHCQETGEYQERTTAHLETCPKVKVPCPNPQCPVGKCRNQLDSHRITCRYGLVSCKYAKVGCEEMHPRKDVLRHEEEDNQLHLRMTTKKVLELTEKVALIETNALTNITEVNSRLLKSTRLSTLPRTIRLTNYLKCKSDNDSFYSTPFYTSYNGYKMCLRVDANGWGDEGTHVSAGAFLMKGDNDDSLSWPFTGTVTFELLNQLEDRNHYKEITSFRADRAGSQRVVDGEIAIDGWGNSKFISHADLDYNASKNTQYLKDDTLVFRIVSAHIPGYKPWLE